MPFLVAILFAGAYIIIGQNTKPEKKFSIAPPTGGSLCAPTGVLNTAKKDQNEILRQKNDNEYLK